ncbi:hypothetical protein [Variovorax saccharolyticus]|uniref:hypothetical protein n=1 Tax=Variovorax saccharolyticus TaxID=3053516 RepID=UPI0025770D60|nr:hypothetical protein [Variovorax sp. J31P216]MDM0025547.1 hypothetical protein [Variovorax sp. J31P216]
MGVLVAFDAQANWAETHVCDSLLLGSVERLGAAWGRSKVESPGPTDAALAALLDSRRDEVAEFGARFGTGSVERIRLLPEAAHWPERRRDWRRLDARDGWVVHWVLEGTLLVYLQAASGYLAVLCEAGEWLAIPAGLLHLRDAGEAPELDLLVLSQPGAGIGPAPHGQGDAGLPSLDEFVDTMLELTGHAADE